MLAGPMVEPQPEDRRRYAPQILLALGWVGLFAYCAAYLSEDMPFRTLPAQTLDEPLIDQTEDLPRQITRIAAPEPSTTSTISATAEEPAVNIAPAPPIPETALLAPAATAHQAMTSADYVGTWGPTADACGAPSRRKGYLPATITPERAKAGDTVCTFRDAHRTGNAWIMAADCGDRDRRWSSKVRLVVDGDRLTWTSAWGTSAYTRCNRRAG
jgi:hypothetical protein